MINLEQNIKIINSTIAKKLRINV